MAEDTAAVEVVDSTGAGVAVFMEAAEAASVEVAGSAEAEDFVAVVASAGEDLADIAEDTVAIGENTEAIAEGLAQDVPTHRRLAEAATDEDSAAPTAADTGQDVMAGLTAVVTDTVADALARAGRARERAVLGRRMGDSAHQEGEVIQGWRMGDGMVLGQLAEAAHQAGPSAQGQA